MLSTMTSENTRQLLFLAEQSSQVLQNFCKLATDYLQKGPNLKIYGTAANKLLVEPRDVRSSVEGLINLLLESGKRRLSVKAFQESVESLGFDNEKASLLGRLYETERPKIVQVLSIIGLRLPQYCNIEWRFQVEIASRSSFGQLVPLIAIDLTLDKNDDTNEDQHFLLQIDPTNLRDLARQLEFALQEAQSRCMRKIKRSVKL